MTDPTNPADPANPPAPSSYPPPPSSYPPAPPAPAASAYSSNVGRPGVDEDPGRMLGIVALVLAFFFQIAGLIVGIIARNKSKAAGYSNGLATAAIWISIVLMVLGIIALIAAIALGGAIWGGVAEYCEQNGGVFEQDGVTYECP